MAEHTFTLRATIDFETRSACSLRQCGSWRYSLDPTTEVLCLAYRLPHWEKGKTALWHPAFIYLDIDQTPMTPELQELFDWINAGKLIEAHNAWFERGIWRNIMVPKYGFPIIAHHQWRCSAAKAATHALPRNLEEAAEVSELEVLKDTEGAKVMRQVMKPRKPKKSDWSTWNRLMMPCRVCNRKGRVPSLKKDGTPTVKGVKCEACGGTGARSRASGMPLLYNESRELFERLWTYCRQDVLTEEELSLSLPDLNEHETEIFLTDQAINERGFGLDPEAIDAALAIIDEEFAELNAELLQLTGGAVERATQRERMLVWLESQGVKLSDTRKETIEWVLSMKEEEATPWTPYPNPVARRGLELMQALGKSSTAKYVKARDWMCPDNRVHGGLLFHGASTGRWSGAGLQPHNFPKGKLKDMEDVWSIIKHRRRDVLPLIFADDKGNPLSPMDCLSSALRGIIVPTPGYQLYVADYASIEARVLLWLAGDTDALKVFREGQDIYCYMADDIYGYKTNKHDHPKERGIGKIAVLGLGYQMGPSKFVDTCKAGGVTMIEDSRCLVCGRFSRDHRNEQHEFEDEFEGTITAVKVVNAYRSKFWRVKDMWENMETASMLAVTDDDVVSFNGVSWFMDGGFLYCELPSGRRLAYPEPEVQCRRTAWGQMKDMLTFKGTNAYSHTWSRLTAYGGMLTENIVQAVARDLMAEAMYRCEMSDTYTPVLTVHDELIAEAKLGAGDVKEFEHLMAANPSWAAGCPVEAEGWRGLRYRK